MRTFKIKGTQIAREYLPPVLLRMYRYLFLKTNYSGTYKTWTDARKISSGYDSSEIIQKVVEGARKVRSGDVAYERDSFLFDKIQHSWPLLAGLLWVASRNGNRLSLTDFGGGLGSSYYQNRGFLDHLEQLRWSIVEQEKFVEIGKKEFENKHVRFYGNIKDSQEKEGANVILFSSVLQYLEKPYDLLEQVGRIGYEYVLVDRTPFIPGNADRLCVQFVTPEIYKASYPSWFFGTEKFLAAMTRDYRLVADFEGQDRTEDIPRSRFGGYIFSKKP